jgi:hypothetical protein
LNRWIEARRNHKYFLAKKAECSEQEINLRIKYIAKTNEQITQCITLQVKVVVEKLAFGESSKRIKSSKLKDLRKSVSFHELANATNVSL